MASVTKTYSSKINVLTISPDGKTVGVSVGWTDEGGKQIFSSENLKICGGKVIVGSQEVGQAPAEVAQQAASLAAFAKTTVDSLVSAKKITP